MNFARTALCALALCLSGCAADQYYQAGQDWEAREPLAAMEYYMLCLDVDPNHELARQRLVDVDFYGPLLDRAEGSQDRGEHLTALALYDQLVEIAALSREAGGRPLPEGVDLESRRADAILGAATDYYDQGEAFRAQGYAKKASKAFRRCLALDPSNAKALAQYEEQKAAATLRIAVLLECPTPGFENWGTILSDRVVEQAIRRQPEFLEFVDRNHLDELLDEHDLNASGLVDMSTAAAQGKLLGLSSTVFGTVRIEQADTGWRETPGENTAVIQVMEGKVLVDVEISARWVLLERRTRGALSANYQVISVETGKILAAVTDQAFEAKDFVQYARLIDGDPAAVPYDIRELLDAPEREPKSPRQLASGLLPSVAAKLAAKLVKQFR